MLRRLFADKRLCAALEAMERCGKALGDLAAAPGSAAAFLPPSMVLLRESRAAGGDPRGSAAVSAAEEFVRRLEKVFSEMVRFDAAPDLAVKESLLCLQRACALCPRLLSRNAPQAGAQIHAISSAARKALAGAKAAAAGAPDEFTLNIKFSSIYSELDAVFDALERCAEALQEPQ